MSLDARRETAATLLGVARSGGSRGNNGSDSGKEKEMNTAAHTDKIEDQNEAEAPPCLHSHAGTIWHNPDRNLLRIPEAHAPSTTSTPLQTMQPGSFLSMSSIGFGIDSSSSASWGNATEACLRALQDAMVRSTLRLPMAPSAQNELQILVQLGVPTKQGSNDVMFVDLPRLRSTLPIGVPVLPINVGIGGMFVQSETEGSPSICSAVACITLQLKASEPSLKMPATTRASPQIPPDRSSQPGVEATPTSATIATPRTKSGEHCASAHEAMPRRFMPRVSHADPYRQPSKGAGGNSIDMLAMISEEIRLAVETGKPDVQKKATPPAPLEYLSTASMESLAHQNGEAFDSSSNFEPNLDEDGQLRNGTYNYQKLPPGLTMKNNRRLFVKHSYRDFSSERPLPVEEDLLGNSAASLGRDASRTFPLKLHETLSQIETDGLSNIVGWLPHGRSFRIFKQKEFAEIILPQYFVMTKKSSFLRQLNLYGFNRFSAGIDQGSYYHEKFLRGMRFLCRRMSRQKVNGNRIRSAGNPDEEPSLSSYPCCPPPLNAHSTRTQVAMRNTEKKHEYDSRKDPAVV